MLVILTDIDGYYDANPKTTPGAKLLKHVARIPSEALDQSHTPNNEFATGGIVTKLKAADFLLENGKKMFLSSGFDLTQAKAFLLDNNHVGGTLFAR